MILHINFFKLKKSIPKLDDNSYNDINKYQNMYLFVLISINSLYEKVSNEFFVEKLCIKAILKRVMAWHERTFKNRNRRAFKFRMAVSNNYGRGTCNALFHFTLLWFFKSKK